MKHVYNKVTKEYELEISIIDMCYTCGYNDGSCPLLQELRNKNVLVRNKLQKSDCSLYFYLQDDNESGRVEGMYLGNFKEYFEEKDN